MELYQVGGSVRDQLLGRTSKDIDFVVVGSTPEEMEQLGYRQVGADFPVFLDANGVEYALARIERKTGTGYHGFECEYNNTVTLEDDLKRRDLTINSMARRVVSFEHHGDPKDFEYDDVIVDPYGGQQDLRDCTLRHTSDAFREDPVRVLRIARFSARYHFDIADHTMALMQSMVEDGELEHLVKERVWTEMEKTLSEPWAHRFFEVLHTIDADQSVFGVKLTDRCINRFRLAHAWKMDISVLLITLEMQHEVAKQRCGAPQQVVQAIDNFKKFVMTGIVDDEHDEYYRAHNFYALCKQYDVLRRRKNHRVVCDLILMQVLHDPSDLRWMSCNQGLIDQICAIKFSNCTEEEQQTPKHKINEMLWEKRKQLIEHVVKG